MAWTTDDLVTTAKRSGWLPTATGISASDLLAWGDECIAEDFTELLKNGREEFGIVVEDVALTSGTSRYRLPRRASLRTIRGVTFVDLSGVESPADEVPSLESWRYSGSRYGAASATYRFEGDEFVLADATNVSGCSLRVRYYGRHSRLIEVSAARRIQQAMDAETLKVDVTVTPPATLTTVGALVDIVRGDSPFPTLYADRQVKAFSTPNVTLEPATPVVVAEISTSGLPGVRADYLCPRDCTVFPPLPQEMHGALSWGVVSRALESTGDQRFALAERRYRTALDRLRNAAEPRNQDRKPRIVDHGGRLRAGRMRGWR